MFKSKIFTGASVNSPEEALTSAMLDLETYLNCSSISVVSNISHSVCNTRYLYVATVLIVYWENK